MTIPPLDRDSLSVVGFSDAGFANNENLTSQLGMLILLKGKDDNSCIVRFSSRKFRRVTRSVLAPELHAFASCYDNAVTLSYDFGKMLGCAVDVLMFTD